MKLLYAEDEPAMAEAVTVVLTFNKYQVDAVSDGEQALDYAQEGGYDGIILDVMMPKLSGLEVLRALRERGDRTPVLLLTAKTQVEDRIEGLDLGADDYLPKPFAMGELLARIRAMLRRREAFHPDILTFGDLSLNPAGSELSCGGHSVSLSRLEYRMMEALMVNSGICLSTEDLLEKVWGYDSEADESSVWVYLSYLRKHLAAISSTVSIAAKRGIGYTLRSGQEPKESGKK